MRTPRPALVLLLCVLIPASLSAQQSTTPATQPVARDPQAVALVQQAISVMGASAPSDSIATGTVAIVAGSLSTEGTYRVLTRGLNQSSEQIQTPDISQTTVYSGGQAEETRDSVASPIPVERAITSFSSDFAVVFLVAALNNPDISFQLIGAETVDSVQVQHVRFWNTFPSQPSLKSLASFTITDLWTSVTSGVPYRLSYTRHEAGGDAPPHPSMSTTRTIGT